MRQPKRELWEPSDAAPGTSYREAVKWLDHAVEVFDKLLHSKESVSYGEWAEAVVAWKRPERGDEEPMGQFWRAHSQELLVWMWKALLAMPAYGADARRAIAVGPKGRDHVPLFDAGAEFLVAEGSGPTSPIYSGVHEHGLVLVRTLEPMTMSRGKSGFLECDAVRCHVWIPVRDPQSREREQTALGPAVEEVVVHPHAVRGTVGSLNQASAVASRRRAPHRRAHVGNIYERVAWTDRTRAVTLHSIRDAVHEGRWYGIDTPGLVERPIYRLSELDPDGPAWPCQRDGSVAAVPADDAALPRR